MATQSATQLHAVKIDNSISIGLSGLMRILMRHTYKGDPNYADLGQLTDQELVTIANQSRNVGDAAMTGIETVGELISAYDTQTGLFDHNRVGWLTTHLAETAQEMSDINAAARTELACRGFDHLGARLSPRAAA